MQQAVEHSLTYYYRRPAWRRETVAGDDCDSGVLDAFLDYSGSGLFHDRPVALPWNSQRGSAGYLFCFGALMGLFFIGRIRNMAAEYNLIAPDEYTYRDPERKGLRRLS